MTPNNLHYQIFYARDMEKYLDEVIQKRQKKEPPKQVK